MSKFCYFKERNAHIIAAYKAGATIQQLVERYQFSEYTTKRIVGHRTPRKQGKGIRDAIKLRNQNIVGDAKRGWTVEELCKGYDLSKVSVLEVLRKNNYGLKQMNADKELRELVKKHKAIQVKKLEPPKKYTKEWTELQWKEAYRREQLGVIL